MREELINNVNEVAESFQSCIKAFISIFSIFWKLNPILMSLFYLWGAGFVWTFITNQRGFLLSLVWFIPSKWIINYQLKKEDAIVSNEVRGK